MYLLQQLIALFFFFSRHPIFFRFSRLLYSLLCRSLLLLHVVCLCSAVFVYAQQFLGCTFTFYSAFVAFRPPVINFAFEGRTLFCHVSPFLLSANKVHALRSHGGCSIPVVSRKRVSHFFICCTPNTLLYMNQGQKRQ